MLDKPLFTIITVCYNEKNIESTCRSLLSQSFQNFEWIVIDGGSTDGTLDVLDKYRDRIDVLISEKDSGIFNAMNKGIRLAKGEYLNFMNGGDYFMDFNCLEDVNNFLSREGRISDLVYGDSLFTRNKKDSTIFRFPDEIGVEYFFYSGFLAHQACFYKRDVFEKCGLYNEGYSIAADSEKNIQLIVENNCLYSHINQIISVQDQTGVSSIPSNKLDQELKEIKCKYLIPHMKKKEDAHRLESSTRVSRVLGIPFKKKERNSLYTRKTIFGLKMPKHFINVKLRGYRRKIGIYRSLALLHLPFLTARFNKKKLSYIGRFEAMKKRVLNGDGESASNQERDKNHLISVPAMIGMNEIELVRCLKSSKPRKILFASHDASLTGAPYALSCFALEAKKMGYAVCFLSPYEGGLRDHCRKVGIPFVLDTTIMSMREENEDCRYFKSFASEFDLIVFGSANYGCCHMVDLLKSVPVRKYWWMHEGSDYYANHCTIKQNDFRQKSHNVDKILAGGQYAARITNAQLGGDVAEIFNYGLEDAVPGIVAGIAAHDKLTIGICGTFEPRKCQDVFLDAVAKLPEELQKKARWIMIGRKPFADYADLVIQKSKSVPCVELLEELSREEFSHLMESIDVMVLPSKDDPMPIVLTEAFMHSKIVVCSDCTGTSSFITDRENGFIVEAGNTDALADILTYILEHVDQLPAIAARGRKIYEEHFSENVFRSNVEKLLNQAFEHPLR